MAYRCEHCGAVLKITEGDGNVTCEYCDTTFSVQDLAETDSEDVLQVFSVEKLLARGEILLEDEYFPSAGEIYRNVLMIDPTCARAYIGQIQAVHWIRLEKDIFRAKVDIIPLAEYQRAIQFASPEYLATLNKYRQEAEYEKADRADQRAATAKKALKASVLFENLGDYQDAPQRATACKNKARALSALSMWDKITYMIKQYPRQATVLAWLTCFLVYFVFLRLPFAKMEIDTLINQGNYQQAIEVINRIDQPEKLAPLIERVIELQYQRAEEFEEKGYYTRAWLIYMYIQNYEDARMRADNLRTLSRLCGSTKDFLISLRREGTLSVETIDGQQNDSKMKKTLESWRSLVYFTTYGEQIVAIRQDGRIQVCGNLSEENSAEALNQRMGKELIAIEPYKTGYVGLKRNGTLIFSKDQEAPAAAKVWTNIKMIQSNGTTIVGVTHDGKVKCTTATKEIQEEILQWNNVISATMGDHFLAALKSDGTVAIAGDFYRISSNNFFCSNVSMISVKNDTIDFLENNGVHWHYDLSPDPAGERLRYVDADCVHISPSETLNTTLHVNTNSGLFL